MTNFLKQGEAVTILMGQFESDCIDVLTDIDFAYTDIRLSKNGNTPHHKADPTDPVHIENGYYSVVLNAADTSELGRLRVMATSDANYPGVKEDFTVLPTKVFNSLILGIDQLETQNSHITDDYGTAEKTYIDRLGSGGNTTPQEAIVSGLPAIHHLPGGGFSY